MLFCCNRHFSGGYCRVLSNTKDFYWKILFGICPNCGTYRLSEYKTVYGKAKIKNFSGTKAYNKFLKIEEKLKYIKSGSKTNQNYYYGDFKPTKRKDSEGNTIYLQLKRNFNNEIEVLGEIKTIITKIT